MSLSTVSSPPPDTTAATGPPVTLKIVIAGGFGAGKTTLVGAVSEIPPLRTEETISCASTGTDSLSGIEGKTTTTVTMDFGRITFTTPAPMVLFLFGTPGQDRFRHTWGPLSEGAVGAVVLADTRRLQDCFTAIAHFEQASIPFIVAVNEFDGAHRYPEPALRTALDLPSQVPIIACDARETRSAATTLIHLVRHARTLATAGADL
ncbi:GTP-binding protein [Streptomyces sp. NPDC051018]|uniref:GTP-binding protein n=1 Tax=Streptomyces sp. NPDC051018 TaxID=3365639 RepID=UPI0037A3A8EA